MKPLPQLSDLLRLGDERGELVRIADPVAAHLELGEMARQLADDDPVRIMLFEQVSGSRFPAVVNLWGTPQRIAEGLAAESFEQALERLQHPQEWDGELSRSWNWLRGLRPSGEKPGGSPRHPLSQQIVHLGRDVNLGHWPIPRLFASESGPTITAGLVFTQHPMSEEGLISHTVLEPISGDTLAVHWPASDPAWDALAAARVNRRQLPVAIVLGGTAPLWCAAEAAHLPGTSAGELAARLASVPLEFTRARTIELDVPGDAELILEGVIDPECDFHQGVIATSLGELSAVGPSPVMLVTAVTHRAQPVFPITLPGRSGEHQMRLKFRSFLATQALQPLNVDVAEVVFPSSGAGMVVVIAIHKRHAHQGKQVLHAAWGMQPLASTKLVVVVDAEIPLNSEENVWAAVARHLDPRRDVMLTEGLPSAWDTSLLMNVPGGKLGLDATRPLPGEVDPQQIPFSIDVDPELAARVRERLTTSGLLR